MHEIGSPAAADAQQWADVKRWRKAERQRLIEERMRLDAADRRRFAEQIAAGLDEVIGDGAGQTVSIYWPFRGEPDLRPWMEHVSARGGRCALPVVVARDAPLLFRAWQPGAPLDRGVWNIPVPPEGTEVTPEIVIAPVVGFDPACDRLGYGGGFFDRTLAVLPGRPRIIGVGYAQAAIPSIYPQPHDVPMDLIVTERGITHRRICGGPA